VSCFNHGRYVKNVTKYPVNEIALKKKEIIIALFGEISIQYITLKLKRSKN